MIYSIYHWERVQIQRYSFKDLIKLLKKSKNLFKYAIKEKENYSENHQVKKVNNLKQGCLNNNNKRVQTKVIIQRPFSHLKIYWQIG